MTAVLHRVTVSLALATSLLAGVSAAAAQETTISLGLVRSISNGANLWGIEKGYFKEAGINLKIEDLDTSANVLAMLAQGRLQIVEGGVSAGYFNGLQKNLPITMVVDRVSSPLGHNLMIRPDLKDQIRQLRDLKGKIIASNGTGSVSTYEVGRMLETEGITIADLEVKVIPFPQMAVAFRNKAIDAAIVIPPFTAQFIEGGFAVPFKDPDDLVKPHPMSIAVSMINTDWAKSNDKAARAYYGAYLRAVRDYCQAYHGGSNRAAMIDLLIKTKTETRPELLYKYPWPARSPNGTINTDSVMDMQRWYVESKMSNANLPLDRVVNTSYAREAAAKLPPFELENKDSKLQGCR
jgi:NitT/TauT family transport system substrate-binding protein